MGTIILIIALIIEIGFTTYCLVTQSKQEKVQGMIRVGALGAFVLFTLLSVIQWSFRWYGLTALLFIWAALGTSVLVSKKVTKKEFSAGRVVINSVGRLFLICLVLVPAMVFPQYKQPPMTGKHPVATANFTYTDQNRIETFTTTGEHRSVNVEFWYPKDGSGPYPLVVFSHGAFGIKTSNTSTFMELASNGYVVCSIDHPYHSLYTIGADKHMVRADQAFIQEVVDLNSGKYDDEAEFKIQQKWLTLRTADINFVLDTVLAQAKDANSGAVYQLIDTGKIGLMGHSLGAAASAQVARERSDIGAVIDLDADLIGEYVAYQDGKNVMNETVYPVPLLTIFADDMLRLMDVIPNAETVVAVKHVMATAPNAYEIHFAGTDHMSLTDLPLVSPVLVSVINSSIPKGGGVETDKYATVVKMNQAVLQFFNVFLKSEGSFNTEGLD